MGSSNGWWHRAQHVVRARGCAPRKQEPRALQLRQLRQLLQQFLFRPGTLAAMSGNKLGRPEGAGLSSTKRPRSASGLSASGPSTARSAGAGPGVALYTRVLAALVWTPTRRATSSATLSRARPSRRPAPQLPAVWRPRRRCMPSASESELEGLGSVIKARGILACQGAGHKLSQRVTGGNASHPSI